jgi:uncharacterized protein YcbX
MDIAAQPLLGELVALWRYPVKSMMGEERNAAEVGGRGLLGDRAYAVIDVNDGRVASAKSPHKYGRLFDCRAALLDEPALGSPPPPVRITLPDGRELRSDRDDVDRALSELLGRAVRLIASVPESPRLEEYWPDIEGLPHRDTFTDEAMPTGTFFDLATIHLLTTATLDALRRLEPAGRFEVRRFRPNLVVATPEGGTGFVEDDWIGQVLHLGGTVRLEVTGPCPRCVMTTLPQSDLPKDPGILRAAVRHHGGHVGVYAAIVEGGEIRRGDRFSAVLDGHEAR